MAQRLTDSPFRYHLMSAKNNGVTKTEIAETLTHAAFRMAKEVWAADSWFSHLAVEVPGVETSNEWLEAVSDADYIKVTTNKERNENDR